jgi:hypothetical protein
MLLRQRFFFFFFFFPPITPAIQHAPLHLPLLARYKFVKYDWLEHAARANQHWRRTGPLELDPHNVDNVAVAPHVLQHVVRIQLCAFLGGEYDILHVLLVLAQCTLQSRQPLADALTNLLCECTDWRVHREGHLETPAVRDLDDGACLERWCGRAGRRELYGGGPCTGRTLVW